MTVALVRSPGIPSEHEMMVFQTMAKSAVGSKMYRNTGDQEAIMMIMLAAREMGIQPMMALNGGLNLISGKVEISARMMNALIRKAGHRLSVLESTDETCTIKGTRNDGDTATSTFTLDEAKRAGLVKEAGGWKKWPKDMCFARALSRLARQLFPDVIGVGYVEGEISEKNTAPCLPDDSPQDGEPAVDCVVPTAEELAASYLEKFDREDQGLALKYFIMVKEHFGWSAEQTIRELLKDFTRTFNAFTVWKNKQKLVEEDGLQQPKGSAELSAENAG